MNKPMLSTPAVPLSRRLLCCVAAAPALYSGAACAHVKWFVDVHGAAIARLAQQPYTLTEPAVMSWFALIAATVTLALCLDRYFGDSIPTWLQRQLRLRFAVIHRLLQLALGVPLLLFALQGRLLAPPLLADTVFLHWLAAAEAIAACLLIAGFHARLSALLVMLVWLGVAAMYGAAAACECLQLIGLSLALLAARGGGFGAAALWFARTVMALSLISAAFTEKLLDPRPALEFLHHFDINFMRQLGFDYSDRLFVLSAGSCEFLFGLLLLLGSMVRLTAVALVLFLVASNSYFLLTGHSPEATVEAIGHAPIFAVLFLILLYGKGWGWRQLVRELSPARLREFLVHPGARSRPPEIRRRPADLRR